MQKPSAQARPHGGFNQGLGNFNEHLDENALHAASQQKALAQQGSTATGQTPPPGNAPGTQPAAEPRDVGSISEELLTRPVSDIKEELSAFVDINLLLGLSYEDDPETQQKKQQLHQRMQKLTAAEQERTHQLYQEKMQRKRQDEEEALQRKQQQQAAAANTLVVPTGKSDGAVGPGGTGKQRAAQKLQQDRQTLGGPQSAN
ncbi:MAG: hypothetical protein M3Q81_00635 [bacterium]|nr:hypothetical protein [bacterium]